jgi:amidophosphoribosyltransferase
MSDLKHECGVAAVYHLPAAHVSKLVPTGRIADTTLMLPRILLDIQNRGQLAAGMTSYNPDRNQLIDTHKDVGTVTEVFALNHQDQFRELMNDYSGQAAIGHVRYATCGKDDRSYAQPFERHHIAKSKWFSFGFNGQLANYQELRDEILSQTDFHLARETDTEIIMHLLSQELSDEGERPDLLKVLQRLAKRLDGAWNIVFLNALGDMVVARDPLGIRPLVYAKEGDLFAAASESVALTHLGFAEDSITSLQPGEAIIIQGPPPAGSPELTSEQRFRIERFAESPRKAHCFFEWIYFANVGSTLDERSVYLSRKHLGEELARVEDLEIDEDTVVVPVPDTAKAAADSMAFQLKVPSVEGLIRNRYIGRTFIEGTNRADKVRMKYTPLPEVLRGKKVILVEDSIVRSTTMMALLSQLRERGGAKEIHVRVACPPLLSPCFYGIDMSTKNELFAARHMAGEVPTPEEEAKMARIIGADTLRYLPIESIARCIGIEADSLCQACVDSKYPTADGQKLYQLALKQFGTADEPIAANRGRTYDTVGTRT